MTIFECVIRYNQEHGGVCIPPNMRKRGEKMSEENMRLFQVGVVRSSLAARADCPKQGFEGGVEAEVLVAPEYREGLDGLEPGRDVLLLTWLHRAERDVLKVHPRGNTEAPLKGVFATRSPARPNPIGLHRVKILELEKERGRLRVAPLEALDGTPVLDIKPVLRGPAPEQ
jgi:L-fuculose-phosphate aldolase